MKNKKPLQIVLLLVVVGLVYGGKYLYEQLELQGVIPGSGETGVAVETVPPPSSAKAPGGSVTFPVPEATVETVAPEPTVGITAGDRRIAKAAANGTSDFMVETGGVVDRVLSDDREGSRHQRFVVRLANDITVLIAHNIDLAPRAPVDEGDRVRFRGEYEWNDRGGVIHWTHHDPKGWREGGWIELDGRRYE